MIEPEPIETQPSFLDSVRPGEARRGFADRVGEAVSGPVTKVVPFGVFVRVAEGIEGLLPLSDHDDRSGHSGPPPGSPDEIVQVGETISVAIAEVDLQRHRVRLARA